MIKKRYVGRNVDGKYILNFSFVSDERAIATLWTSDINRANQFDTKLFEPLFQKSYPEMTFVSVDVHVSESEEGK